MKTLSFRLPNRRRQTASAVLVLITLLAIMVILATADSKVLFHLHREIRLLEVRQIERLNTVQTNTLAVAETSARHEAR